MIINIDEFLKDYKKKYGKLEVYRYGAQFSIEQDGVVLYRDVIPWETYRKVWECSKRVLDEKEDEIWMIKTKVKRH